MMDGASGRALGDQFEALRKQTLCGQDLPGIPRYEGKETSEIPQVVVSKRGGERELKFLTIET